MVQFPKAKIRVLVCGGTIVMVKNKEGLLTPPDQEKSMSSILSLEPKIAAFADVSVRFIANIDSSNMTPDIWDDLAKAIYEEYEDYDGFVITHGTDTMAYTSSALSFALSGLGKPVVLTGAQIPGHIEGSDAKHNFFWAVKLATMNLAGVVICFGNRVHLGSRATKVSHSNLEAFVSVNAEILGEIDTEIRISAACKKRHSGPLVLKEGFDPRVTVISLVPGSSLEPLETLLSKEIRGIVLIAFGTGNLPKMHLPFLEKAQKAQIPVVIRTYCLEGTTKMHLYETGKQALFYDVIEAYDMSLESTVTKFMWRLGQDVEYHKMRSAMHCSVAGEINEQLIWRDA